MVVYRIIGFQLVLVVCVVLAAGSLVLYSQQEVPHHVEVPTNQKGFHPETAQEVTESFNGLAATFKPSSPMIVVMESQGSTTSVTLPKEFAQLTSARLYQGSKLVIAGMVNGNVSEVAVVDSNKGSVIDHFLCYSPAISPNGRYVAFVKFYPEHGVSSAEDHYMLYDVQQGSKGNRPSWADRHPSLVGKVVFPPKIENRQDDNVDVGDRPIHSMASDGFFWNNQSSLVVFADQLGAAYTVVVVKVANGAFSSESVAIPSQWICPGSTLCSEHLTSAQFITSPVPGINVLFRGVNGTPAKVSQVNISWSASGVISAVPNG
jgi:hypothetical protein